MVLIHVLLPCNQFKCDNSEFGFFLIEHFGETFIAPPTFNLHASCLACCKTVHITLRYLDFANKIGRAQAITGNEILFGQRNEHDFLDDIISWIMIGAY